MNLLIIITSICLVLDRISKILVIKYLSNIGSIKLINNFFYLTYAENTGAAFSFLEGKRYFFILIAVLVVIFLFYYLKKNYNKINMLEKVSFSLIIGGAIGNVIDRIWYGYVVDFLDFRIFGYHYPIFNFADTFIVVGAIILFISMIRDDVNERNNSRRR